MENVFYCEFIQSVGSRHSQEDSATFVVDKGGAGLFVIADGMGGMTAGALASKSITQACEKFFAEYADLTTTSPNLFLSELLKVSNDAVRDNLNGATGGSTILAVLIVGHEIWWLSVGDSVLLLFRDGKLARLNANHSYIDYKTRTFCKAFEHSNILASAVMGKDILYKDIPSSPFRARKNDLLLVSSDGIMDIAPKGLEKIIKTHFLSPGIILRTAVSEILRDYANTADNITSYALRFM